MKTLWSLVALITISNLVYSQTAGNLTFSITTTSTGGYSPKNLVVIWIENASSNFVKTNARYASVSNYDHLAVWTTNSGSNLTDATTGATRTSHGTLNVVWNGTDVNGTIVPDGTYNLWIEMAWAPDLTTGKTYTSFPFTKGPGTFHSAPSNTTNFSSITLDWVAGVSSTKALNNPSVSVFPNPTEKFVNITFQKPVKDCMIQILDVVGKEVYTENLYKLTSQKSIDISKFKKGVYFINLKSGGNDFTYRIVKI